jgi:hypothetical protein
MSKIRLTEPYFCHYSKDQYTDDITKTSCEVLVAYFPLIRHEPHRKRRLQQFFVAAGMSLPSSFLATIERYIDPQTHVSSNSSTVTCIRCLGTAFAEPLPSNERRDTLPGLCLVTIGRIHIHTGWWEWFMKYAAEKGSGAMIHILSPIKIGSSILKLKG